MCIAYRQQGVGGVPGGVLLTASRGCEECQAVLTWMLPLEEPELIATSK